MYRVLVLVWLARSLASAAGRITGAGNAPGRCSCGNSPTTTGNVERWHQSIQVELLDGHGPFESLKAAQAAVDAWRVEYNTVRPHQALDMATPAERFRPVPVEQRAVLGLWLAPELAPTGPSSEIPECLDPIDDEPDEPVVAAAARVPAIGASTAEQPAGTLDEAVAVDAGGIDRSCRSAATSGCGQQFWLGPTRAGRKLTLWIDTTTVHLSLAGQHLKTLPSRLTSIDLAGSAPRRSPRWPSTGLTVLDPTHRQHTRGDPAHGQRHRHGLHRRQIPLGRPALRRPADHPAPADHPRPPHARPGRWPAHRADPDPYPTRPPPGARTPGPAPLLDQRPARVQRTVSCRGGT